MWLWLWAAFTLHLHCTRNDREGPVNGVRVQLVMGLKCPPPPHSPHRRRILAA